MAKPTHWKNQTALVQELRKKPMDLAAGTINPAALAEVTSYTSINYQLRDVKAAGKKPANDDPYRDRHSYFALTVYFFPLTSDPLLLK